MWLLSSSSRFQLNAFLEKADGKGEKSKKKIPLT